jgi:anti-sigma regulatory factor (Ser/Thr protein kinase)
MTAATITGFDHLALFYRGAEDYVTGVGGFITEGVASGAPVAVAVPGDGLELLRSGLPADVARQVAWTDMTVAGRNPGRIIHQVLLPAAEHRPGRQAYIVGEPIWPGRSAMEYPACAAHEALINQALADRDARILCPYDAVGLPETALADAERTHPVLVAGHQIWQSRQYDPQAVERFNQPLPTPPPQAAHFRFGAVDDLARLREFVTSQAAAAGVRSGRIEQLVLAVNELATNTLEHTTGEGVLNTWTEPGVLVVQVDDTGHIIDPLAGRLPPSELGERGRGLFLVNMMCDLVRLHTTPEGTTLRLHLAL